MLRQTKYIILFGIIGGLLFTLPFYNWVFAKGWDFSEGFPLGWLAGGLTYFSTFFHEIGHTIFLWFYGYFTIPMFDFQHGGGMAYHFGGQNPMILLGVYSLLGYGIYKFHKYPVILVPLVLALILNVTLVTNETLHMNLVNFMGPGFESLIAGFLIFRAVFDLAPRGIFERLLNSIFGFGMGFFALISAHALLHNEAYRLVYFEQKGQHGFGDFDKIATQISFMDFETVVFTWMGLTLVCMATPFVLYLVMPKSHEVY